MTVKKMTKVEAIDKMIEMIPGKFEHSSLRLVVSPDFYNALCFEKKRLVKIHKGIKIICNDMMPKDYGVLRHKKINK